MPDLLRPKPLRLGIQSRLLAVTLAIGLLFVLYIAFNTARQSARDLVNAREQIRLVAGLAGARLDEHLGDVTQLPAFARRQRAGRAQPTSSATTPRCAAWRRPSRPT